MVFQRPIGRTGGRERTEADKRNSKHKRRNAREPQTPSSGCTKNSNEGSKPGPCCHPRNTAVMLFWALLASGQINMRKVDGWQTLARAPIDQPIDLAA